MLVRRNDDAVVQFQHHQFQEWYASFWVEEITRSAGGDENALQTLRNDILNLPASEESILFACERLSQNGDAGAQVVAGAAMQALTIDPMLAAEMIFRSSDAVWQLVEARIVTFAQKWHQEGKIDRALRFMMATGKAEFSDKVWANLIHRKKLGPSRYLGYCLALGPRCLVQKLNHYSAVCPTNSDNPYLEKLPITADMTEWSSHARLQRPIRLPPLSMRLFNRSRSEAPIAS